MTVFARADNSGKTAAVRDGSTGCYSTLRSGSGEDDCHSRGGVLLRDDFNQVSIGNIAALGVTLT